MSNIRVVGAFVSISCLAACGGSGGSGANPGEENDAGAGGSSAASGGSTSNETGGASNGTGGTPAGSGGSANATGGAANGTGGTTAGDDAGPESDAGPEGDSAPADGGACPVGYTGDSCADCALGYVEDGAECVEACSATDCNNGTCELDDTSRPVCVCTTSWDGAACDECAPGYRFGVVAIGDPDVCVLDEPSTTNMALWLDADHDDSFTLGASDAVLEWHSRVPGDTTAFTAGGVAAERPERTIPARGSRNWVSFDGVDDRLRRNVDLQSDTYSLYVVVYASSSKATQTILSGVQPGGVNYGLLLQAQDNADTLFFRHRAFGAATMDNVTVPDFSTAEPTVIEIHRAFSSNISLYSVFDGDDYQGTQGSAVALDDDLDLHLGVRADSVSFRLEGGIGEVVMYTPMLALNQRANVREYLQAKWVE